MATRRRTLPASHVARTNPPARKPVWKSLYPGINTRIIVPYLLAIIVIAGIGVFIITRLVAGSIQERFNNQLLSSASAASSSVVDIERQLLATLRLMVFTEGMTDALAAGDTNRLDLLLRPVAANARIDSVIVFNKDRQGLFELRREAGSTTYSVQPPPSLDAWASIQNINNVDELGDKFADIIPGQPDNLLYISAPAVDSTGNVIGGISVGMTFIRLVEHVRQQALSSLIFYGEDGSVLSSTFPSASNFLAMSGERVVELTSSVQQDTSPIEDLSVDGVPYQILYAPFELRSQQVGLLGVALPSNYIVERSVTSRDLFSLIFVLLFVTVAGLGVLTGRSIVRPVERLVATTRAIRAGDLTRRVGLRTPDELGELGSSFDHMTDELVKRSEQINTLYHRQIQETARLDAVLTSISDAVIVQNPAGKIILQNRTAEEFIQFARSEESLARAFVQLMKQPEALAQPRTVQFADRYFSVLSTQVSLESGQMLGYVIIFRNITALIESERLKDEMILQMSHELRTPLTAARGYTDLLKMMERNLNAQSQTFIENIMGSLTTLERMISQVIDVSTIISNRFSIDTDMFNVSQVLNEQVKVWQPLMAQRDLNLLATIAPSTLWVEGDAKRIGQVVDHLLRNAYSYTLPGGTVELHLESKRGGVAITIADTGVGIAPDEIHKVFDRMYRGSSAAAGPTDARGLGLGLYISKEIVETHRGRIKLDSQLNAGTVVTVELPIQQTTNGHRS